MARVSESWTFSADVWLWEAKTEAWHFVTLPRDVADEIEFRYQGPKRGFGAVKVRAQIGDTTWDTSIFPSKDSESYILPLKKKVRDAEGVVPGGRVEVELELIEVG